MIFSKTTISLLFVLLVFSIIMANFINLIAMNSNSFDDSDEGINHSKYLADKYGLITDTTENLVWFLQISDIHISIFRDPGRISQFQQFCDSTVKTIRPIVVLATGDLTDAKTKDNLGSTQVKSEWVSYYNIVKESGVTEHTVWLDIRGNHDNFNLKSVNSHDNFYRNYTVLGGKHMQSYLSVHEFNGVNVAFLGVDACPEPGLKRPFNFVGILDVPEQQHILKLKSEAQAKADHIVWFAHYPTSCILPLHDNVSQRINLRDVIGKTSKSQVYLCGHLHSMGGLVTRMYAKQKNGFLELELGDWKDNRVFRLAAIDHGMFSFVDAKHNTWPLVLVTNPVSAVYSMPGREPLELVPNSKFIRILAFSDVELTTVKISFDKISWMKCKLTEPPLYVCHWLPNLFNKGLHTMYVSVTDEMDKETTIEHRFALDGSIIGFDLTARILLMLNAGAVFQGMFGTLLMMSVMPLIVMRVQKRPPKYSRRLGRLVLKRLWLLSKLDRVFYPLVLYSVYLPFGPWAIGNLIDGHIGAIFAWGIIIGGSYLPEPFTYMYGSVQIVFVQIPLVFVLAYTLEYRLYGQHLRGFSRMIKHFPFIFLLAVQMLLAYFFWLEYGTLCFILGPLRTWSILLSIRVWYKIMTLPTDYCRKLASLSEPPS